MSKYTLCVYLQKETDFWNFGDFIKKLNTKYKRNQPAVQQNVSLSSEI